LRAPAERAVSQYYQIVRRATNRHHAEFIRDRVGIEEGLRRVTDNVQVRYLATCRPGEPCTREHLERAKQRLETDFAVLGLQARFDESLVLLKRAFDWPLPVYCRRNVGANRPPRIAPAVLALARDLHRLDVELYAFAEALFAARLRRQPAGFHFDLWRLRSRNRLSRWLTPPEPSKEHD
jgi:hypothetical protein